MKKAHVVAVAITLIALAVCCGKGSGVHSTGVTTPTSHIPAEPAACAPRAAVNCPQALGGSCTVDSDCTGGINGRCEYHNDAGAVSCGCTYDACAVDADCPSGTACNCAPISGGAGFSGSPTACLPSNCRTDADCPSGFCSTSRPPCKGSALGNYCHTSRDECGNNSDCVDDKGGAAMCVYAPELGHWACAIAPPCGGG